MIIQEELEWALHRLESIGKKLKLVSTFLLSATLLNLMLILLTLGRTIDLYRPSITLLSIFFTFVVFFLAFWFDYLRKDGKSYYDEIAGAMHASSKNTDYEAKNNSIMARIAIQRFMNSYEIPLIPGKYGPGILVVLNIIIIVLWVSLYSQKF